MIFQVKYDQDDQNINLPHDVQQRVNKLKELKRQGYTHVNDKWMTYYTGVTATPINTYITEVESYL
tara:strand:- start:635 stop:832 length:198 start_codon:yes stop_codon:yes gene_type:complete